MAAVTLKAILGAYDFNICGVFCARVGLQPSCVEEHEAWHARWIQAEITYEEFKEAKT
ncbi:hypothetical protein LCGC14_0644030 [marine sediment metagenome]|uniref:Uncharacterized protein n=1 Tax=marine sediment metagenome TaxID=412755 RepID=A0A0F9R3H0_9ZZZZ